MSSASPFTIALAALLHDIGKFAQRAGWRSGRHTVVGGEFVRRYVPRRWREHLYPVVGHHDTPLEGYTTKVVALADRLSSGERVPTQRHHHPRQLLSIFCRLELDPPGEGEAGKPLRAPADRYWPLSPLALDEAVLFPDEEMPPERVAEAYQHLWQGFEAGAEALREAHEADGHLPTYLESMLLLMQRYTWCVPSAYYHALPDVSLYDHSRTTAALAAVLQGMEESRVDTLLNALRQWHRERQATPTAPPPSALEETPVALLVGGDLSGVQDFIYTITSKGAAGALRGRSFYLQLLTEAVARFVLQALELPITNLIYQGGGHFYLLTRPGDEARLREVREDLSRILLAHHRGDLYLALAWEPLAGADFYNGRIADAWGRLAEGLRETKQHRFAELDEALYALFLPQDHGGNEDRQCQVCGREHPGTRPEDGVRKCPPCRSYEALGDELRHARYLWLTTAETPQVPGGPLATPPGGWQEVLAALGVRAGLAREPDGIAEEPAPRLLLALKDDAMEALRPTASTAVGRRFLVNVTPTIEEADAEWFTTLPDRQRQGLMEALTTEGVKELPQELPRKYRGRIKPFTWLEVQSTGIARLGVLRMDVDDLGRIFQRGFTHRQGRPDEERIATLSRMAALSFAMSLYFEGWVEVLAERVGRTEEGRQRLYSIYSGGDDLFFVGAWDAVVELARLIRADLARFAADHPGLHASAGVALVGGKYPLYLAAEDAGEAEGAAKALSWRDDEGRLHRKDAVTFLGRPLPWSRFGLEPCEADHRETVHAMAHWLARAVASEERGGDGRREAPPRALLRDLIRLQQMYEEAARERRWAEGDGGRAGEEPVYWGPWMWRGFYILTRLARRVGASAEREEIEALARRMQGSGFRLIEWIGLAARWAELLTR